MTATQDQMSEFRRLLVKGKVQIAYQELVNFMMSLKTKLSHKFPERFSTGSFYQGTMDMTYFPFTSESLKERGLKIAIVFVYETFRFEVWMAANNKKIQEKYWKLVRESGWDKYRVVPAIQGYDSIIEHVLAEDPDFSDPKTLTDAIEDGVLAFIADVESFLAAQKFNIDIH